MSHPMDRIAEAFSRTADKYDVFATDHPHLTRLRHKVIAHFSRFVPPGSRVLELNAGTGIDAVALAERGYSVHATDIAPGMLRRLRDKVAQNRLQDRVSVQQCSFTQLEKVDGAPYDAVFSDLGGLNCIPDLSPVIRQLPSLLRPGGIVTWVLMPRVCLWEMVTVFSGQFRLAFRRYSRRGTQARLEGLQFPVYYFPPHQAITWFREEYQLLCLEGLSVITPTAESKNLAKRFPRLYWGLAWLDDRLSIHPPWWGWGDFYILTMKYSPQEGVAWKQSDI